MTDAGARRRLSLDERRAELLALGLELFTEQSYGQVSVDAVAARGDVSVGLLYHYFGSKHGFYVAVLEAAADRMLAATLPAAEEGADRLREALLGYFEHVRSNEAQYLTIVRGAAAADAAVATVIESTRRESMRRILDELAVDAPGPMVEFALQGWLSYVEEVAVRWIGDGALLDTEELAGLCQKVLDATLAGLGLLQPRVVDTRGHRAWMLDEWPSGARAD